MPSIITSCLSQSVMVDGRRFEIDIYRLDGEDCWPLEVINDEGGSYVWDDVFATEQATLDTAFFAFENEGPLVLAGLQLGA